MGAEQPEYVMKRIVASVGLVALGAASVYGQAEGPAAKWWSASATLRGFYDDNANTAPDGGNRRGTFGYQVSPSVGVSVGNEQTSFSADYTYSFQYYEQRLSSPVVNPVTLRKFYPDKYDQDHEFNLALNHAFTERYRIKIGDRFVVGQQPDALRTGNFITTPFRVPGDNYANSGTITFNADITPIFGVEVGYNNNLYDYAADKFATGTAIYNVHGIGVLGPAVSPSTAGLLNRLENYAHIDGRWNVTPDTVGILGYQYGDVAYTGDQLIGYLIDPTGSVFTPQNSDVRNSRSHTAYLGVEHAFNPELNAAAKVGASYYDYYNDPTTTASFGPYAMASLSYQYRPDSFVRVGFQESRTSTDIVGDNNGQFIHDMEASVVFANVRHRIAPHLYGGLNATFQHSTFNGGDPTVDGKSERFLQAGADLEYQFNPHFSTHVGYDYDQLASDLANRDYHRNKVYMGVTASY